jgi:hypothetical protein
MLPSRLSIASPECSRHHVSLSIDYTGSAIRGVTQASFPVRSASMLSRPDLAPPKPRRAAQARVVMKALSPWQPAGTWAAKLTARLPSEQAVLEGPGKVNHHTVDLSRTKWRSRGSKLFGALVATWRKHLDHGSKHRRNVDRDQRPHRQHALRFRGRGGERRRQQRLVGGDHRCHGQRRKNAPASGWPPCGGGG